MSHTAPAPPAPEVDETGITEIADGIWIIPDRRVPLVPNVGIVVGDDTVLVVDTAMGPGNGARVLAAAKEKAEGRRLLLTITHFHPEHGFGAQVFRNQATIAYNRAQLDEFHDKGEAYVQMFRTFGPAVAAALDGVELVEPHLVYEGDAEIDRVVAPSCCAASGWRTRAVTRSCSVPMREFCSRVTLWSCGSSRSIRSSRPTTLTSTAPGGSRCSAASRSLRPPWSFPGTGR